MRATERQLAPYAIIATLVASLALAPVGASGAVLPPGNSAANQYTEAYPTQGGSKPARDRGHATPAKALGADNAKRLEAQGADGRAAAELAAATAPATTLQAGREVQGGASPAAGGTENPNGKTAGGGVERGGGSGSPSGSSGLGKVVEQATGSSSSGGLGLLLPLLIAAALVWSVLYSMRRRRRAGH